MQKKFYTNMNITAVIMKLFFLKYLLRISCSILQDPYVLRLRHTITEIIRVLGKHCQNCITICN